MPTPNEIPGNDAPAMTMEDGNIYCFVANKEIDGWYDKDNNTFKGTLDDKFDEDWILIELQGGQGYTISVDGSNRDGDPAGDTILTILDSKGGMVDLPIRTDDIAGASVFMGGPGAFAENSVTFYNAEPTKYYISVKSYDRNPLVDNSGDYTITVTPVDIPGDIVGTGENDKLSGTGSNELIVGKGGDDVLLGNGGDDSLDGGDGNDLLEGGPGEDELTGGKGEDTISYKYSAMMPAEGEDPDPQQRITINLDGLLALGGDAEGDTFVANDIENVEGAMFAENSLTGDRRDNKLWGGMYDDVLIGGSGDDTLQGRHGEDELEGGRGDDTLVGGGHGDSLEGGAGEDTASYAGSPESVTVRLHANQAMGGDATGDEFNEMVTVEYAIFDEDDRETGRESEAVPDIENLSGSGNDDILAGDSRDNKIWGGGGDDNIYGGPHGGNDELHGQAGNDNVYGGRGDDELYGDFMGASPLDENPMMSNRANSDQLYGGKGADKFWGGYGDDTIHADKADSSIDGGPHGRNGDTVSYAKLGARESVTVDLEAGTIPDGGSIMNVENIIGSQGRDTLTGAAAVRNVIEGHDSGDTLNGGGDGAAENMPDILSYRHSDRGVSVTLRKAAADTNLFTATNSPLVTGGHASGDTFAETGGGNTFRDVIGSSDDDDLTGDAKDNMLWGLSGDDRLTGGGGADTIEGGPGEDEMDGGGPGGDGTPGEDVTSTTRTNALLGSDNNDTLSYASSMEGVSVNLGSLSFSGGDAEGDEVETFDWYHDDDISTDPIELSTFEHVTGSQNDDRLTGDVRDNTLTGNGGRDDLRGGAGADTLKSGTGGTMDAPENLDGGSSKWNHDDDLTTPDTDEGAATANVEHMDMADYSGLMVAGMDGINADLGSNIVTKGADGADGADRLVNIERITGSALNDTFIVSDDEGDNFIIDGGAGSDTLSFELSDGSVELQLLAVDHDSDAATPLLGIAHVPEADTDFSTLLFDTDGTTVLERGTNIFRNSTDANPTTAPTVTELYNLQNAEGSPAIHRAWGIENVTGTDFDDIIKGSGEQDNVFMGGAGEDHLDGGAGDDELEGHSDNDELMGGTGDDILKGGSGRDTLTGGAGLDLLRGDGGDDTLQGATADTPADANPDVFLFCVKDGRNVDTIEDFQVGTDGDKIDLRDFGIPDEEALKAIISVNVDADDNVQVIINLDNYGGGRIILDDQTQANWLDADDGDLLDTLDLVDDTSMDVNEDGMIFGQNEIWTDATGGTEDSYDSGEAHDGIFII